MAGATYKDAGLDLDIYRDSMSRLPQLMHRTYSPRTMKLDGGFAGLFRLDFGNQLFNRNYQDPVLVAGTDGAGTKIKVAVAAGKHDTIGIDLVAMCVNDIICCGAEPLFFLDYIVMGRDDPPLTEQLVQGISDGCIASDCDLLGGETAIHPGEFEPGDYDLAGFCVGVVEREQVIDGSAIAAGDVVLGVGSSGLHSNGFSLVRKVVFERAGLKITDNVEVLGKTVGEELLTPTRLYARQLRQVLTHYKVKNVVHGIAHITGGGLAENIERIVPAGARVQLQRDSWTLPPVFSWLQQLGEIADDEMFRVFNMGIGLALIVSSYYADNIRRMFIDAGFDCWKIGDVSEGECGVIWTG